MLGTGSRQILVTFYQMPTCQRFPLTLLQGVAKPAVSPECLQVRGHPTAQHGTAQWGFGQGSIPFKSSPPSSAYAALLALKEGCSSSRAWQEGFRSLTMGAVWWRALQHSSGRSFRIGWK